MKPTALLPNKTRYVRQLGGMLAAATNPRRENWRKPKTSLMMPMPGSTVHLQEVDGFANLGSELVSHLDRWAGVLWRGCRLLGKVGSPISVMWFASSGNVWVNTPCLDFSDVVFAK